RKVREALSELDLAYVNNPCAKGSRNRDTVVHTGGRALFPFLVDPNTGTQMYESEKIIDYLRETYGPGRRSVVWRMVAPLNTATSAVASAVRPRGRAVTRHAKMRPPPQRPLVLYNFEASPYCRKVREVLAELDLHHQVRSVAKNSARRPELIEKGGKMMVPYLRDPNTQTALYESDDIVNYLRSTYG
ncbi:MAG: glutathione S-transferase, partial [Myxococcota bacterium]